MEAVWVVVARAECQNGGAFETSRAFDEWAGCGCQIERASTLV